MRTFFCLFCLLALFASCALAAEYRGKVSWIYDGDTLLVEGLGKVRLLGIDTPEQKNSPRDNFYRKTFASDPKRLRSIARQAKQFNIETAKGEQVKLVTESEERDPHGRLLAYLYLPDGRLLNLSLLENGLASVFRRYPFSRKEEFLAAEAAAQTAKIGLWQE